MKKSIIACLFVATALSSCSIQQEIKDAYKYSATTGFIDYKKYADEGFFITESNSVSFEYSSVGTVLSNEVSGYTNTEVVSTPVRNTNKDDVYGSASPKGNTAAVKTTNEIKNASAESCLNLLVERAKAMGANGIINLKITANNERGVFGSYSASAMAIRTK